MTAKKKKELYFYTRKKEITEQTPADAAALEPSNYMTAWSCPGTQNPGTHHVDSC